MKRRGSSLAGAVCVIGIALLAVLTVGTAASVNVQMLSRSENVQIASLLADSAIQQALAQLMQDPTWGTTPSTKIQYDGPVERSHVLLTFDRNAGVAYSSKNDDDNPQPAWPQSQLLRGGLLPEKRVHLVATAQCRGVQRIREAVVYIPNFTLSLGATGKVHLRQSVVGALDTLDGVDLDAVIADPDKLKPGDLGTNSPDAQAAILENHSLVVGNLQAAGGVQVLGASSVGGELRPYHSSTELPHFDFVAYDPQNGDALNYNSLSAGILGDQNLSGVVRCDGPAVTINGDLNLDNALLYVDGDLKISGGLHGSGAVIVTGAATVEGGSSLTSQDSVALLVKKDLRLVSPSSTRYNFQGMVYTQGDFYAKNFTVVGGFIADGSDASKGNILLDGCYVIRVPIFTQVNFFYPVQLALQVASSNPPTVTKTPLPDGRFVYYGMNPARPDNYPAQPEIWKNQLGDILYPPDRPGSYSQTGTPKAAATYNNPAGPDWGPNPWWNPALLQIRKERINGAEQFVYDLIYTEDGVQHRSTYLTRDAVVTALCDLGKAKTPGYYDNGKPHMSYQQHIDFYKQNFTEWEVRNQLDNSYMAPNFSFDPNRFLKDSSKLRICAWAEY